MISLSKVDGYTDNGFHLRIMFKVWAVDACLLWTLYKMNFPGPSICPISIVRGWLFLSQISLCREYSLPGNLVILLGSRVLQETCLKPRLLPQRPEISQGYNDMKSRHCWVCASKRPLRAGWLETAPWLKWDWTSHSWNYGWRFTELKQFTQSRGKQAFAGNMEISWEFFVPQIC